MSGLLPLSTYNLCVNPFEPVPAIDDEFPVSIRITLAAVDPEEQDAAKVPSTLRILKKSIFISDDEDDLYDEDDEEDEDEDEEEEEEEEEVKEEVKASPKKSPKNSPKKSPKKEVVEEEEEEKKSESDEELEDALDEDDEDSDLEDDVEEYVVCTLAPGVQYQQTIDLTITPDEEVYFVATGSYAIHLTGNYIEHPYDGEDDSDDSDEDDVDIYSDEDDYLDAEEDYDLTPDEEDVISGDEDYDIEDLEDVDDVEGKIQEIIEEEEKNDKKTSSKKDNKKKRQAEEDEEDVVKPKEETKKSKKAKDAKKVEFSKELEQGPTGSTAKKEEATSKKFPTKTLIGGVVVEDRTTGKGPVCKSGQKVGVRYIGKLKNGKVFDKNTSGKPFVFGLGKGEVIKGWDVGVAGMSVGGERRIVIPAPMAYGKQKLPGIPANSELTFDVKLVSIK